MTSLTPTHSGALANVTLPETKQSGEYRPLAWQVKEDSFGYPSVYETNENGGAGDLVCHAFSNHVDLIARAPDLLAENERLREALRRVAARTRDYDTLSMIDLALDPKQTALARARTALSEQEGEPEKDVGREGAFRAGYRAGFDAAKHPFHMPVADAAFAFFSEQERGPAKRFNFLGPRRPGEPASEQEGK